MLARVYSSYRYTLATTYTWNSEVETTWNSLIGWHHKTSTTYLLASIEILSGFPMIFHLKFRDLICNLFFDEIKKTML